MARRAAGLQQVQQEPARNSASVSTLRTRNLRPACGNLGLDHVYILSAGWGLVKSDFLTPYYDITFSQSARGADAYKRRKKTDKYCDLSMLPDDTDEEIAFFGGKYYVPLFCTLTSKARSRRTIFYSADQAPQAPGCAVVKFETTTRTNWHYECVKASLESVRTDRS